MASKRYRQKDKCVSMLVFQLSEQTLKSRHLFTYFTGQAWTDAKQRWKKEQIEDWSELKADELREKLSEKKVLSGEELSSGLRDLCQGCAKQNPASSCFEGS